MKHLRYLKIINYIEVPLNILLGLGMIAAGIVPFLLAPSGMPDDAAAALVINLVTFIVIGVIFFVAAVMFFIAAKKIEHGKGRILQTILAVLCVGSVPLGTAYGIYALWICWMNEETKATFE